MQSININEIDFVIEQSSEVIEAPSKKGTKYWQGHVVFDTEGNFYTCTSSWSTTKDGLSKKNWSTPYYAEPKNMGRANFTDSRTQAYAEYESMVTKEKRIRQSTRPLPMLAQTFSKKKDKIKYPVMVQPKLDGVRMLTDGDDAWSRKNKSYLPEILAHIMPIETPFILDGELMLPNDDVVNKVNNVNSATKKFNENTERLQYHVYDILEPTKPFAERSHMLADWFDDNMPINVVYVDTYIATCEEQVLALHDRFVKMGYEGSIIRNPDGLYAINQRVDDVLKHKDFIDEEFEIVDIIPAGGGSSADVGKFVCRATNGLLFESTATGTEKDRRALLKNKNNHIGKFAKVKYRELTEYGVPFHSNVLEIRETKDKGY